MAASSLIAKDFSFSSSTGLVSSMMFLSTLSSTVVGSITASGSFDKVSSGSVVKLIWEPSVWTFVVSSGWVV